MEKIKFEETSDSWGKPIMPRKFMNIQVMSRDYLESRKDILDMIDTYVISISTPGNRKADIENYKNVCFVSFYDIDSDIFDKGKIYSPISDIQAQIIAKFVKDNYNIFTLIVQCEAGVSRSAGVAAAIAKYYTDNDEFFFKNYIPNRTCYKKVLEALKG